MTTTFTGICMELLIEVGWVLQKPMSSAALSDVQHMCIDIAAHVHQSDQ